jgi:hypothetical protein
MAHYTMNEDKPLTRTLRGGMNMLRAALHQLEWSLGAMNQMSDAQLVTNFGFADTTAAAAAKGEVGSAVGKLTSDASQTNTHAAVQQMLDQLA